MGFPHQYLKDENADNGNDNRLGLGLGKKRALVPSFWSLPRITVADC